MASKSGLSPPNGAVHQLGGILETQWNPDDPETTPDFETGPVARPLSDQGPTAQPVTGNVQIAALACIAAFFLVIGVLTALTSTSLLVVVLGSGFITAGTVALTGALVVQALRAR